MTTYLLHIMLKESLTQLDLRCKSRRLLGCICAALRLRGKLRFERTVGPDRMQESQLYVRARSKTLVILRRCLFMSFVFWVLGD